MEEVSDYYSLRELTTITLQELIKKITIVVRFKIKMGIYEVFYV